jgi:hypothetical protein
MSSKLHYANRRRALLGACAWNAWADRRGYSDTAAATHKQNQRALAALRVEVRHA